MSKIAFDNDLASCQARISSNDFNVPILSLRKTWNLKLGTWNFTFLLQTNSFFRSIAASINLTNNGCGLRTVLFNSG